jgi:hypothetical protein
LWFAAARPSLASVGRGVAGTPGALDDDGVLAALAAGELVADGRPAARVPGGLDQQPADVAVARLGARVVQRVNPLSSKLLFRDAERLSEGLRRQALVIP